MIENHRGHQHLTKTTLIALAEGTSNIHKIPLLCLCQANSLNPLTMILVNPAEEHMTTVKINLVVQSSTAPNELNSTAQGRPEVEQTQFLERGWQVVVGAQH